MTVQPEGNRPGLDLKKFDLSRSDCREEMLYESQTEK